MSKAGQCLQELYRLLQTFCEQGDDKKGEGKKKLVRLYIFIDAALLFHSVLVSIFSHVGNTI
jgi:hypothetical protein